MNAAGFLGFAPDSRRCPWITRFGAFVTNPISRLARSPAAKAISSPFGSGCIIHTGKPNPGLDKVIRTYSRQWKSSDIPVILHIMIDETDDLDELLQKVEDLPGVIAAECSFHPDLSAEQISHRLAQVKAEIPIILQLSPQHTDPLLMNLADLPLNAISIAAPRAAIASKDGTLIQGRYYGQTIFPLSLFEVIRLSKLPVPIIAGGGISTEADIEILLKAGVFAVQLDTVLWD